MDQDEEVLAVAQVLEGSVLELAELLLWLAQPVSQLVWLIP